MRHRAIHSLLCTAVLGLLTTALNAQAPIILHSHNDYAREVPFYLAYSQHVGSIEADTFFIDGEHMVGHEIEDLRPGMSLQKLYLEPILTLFERNGGRPWAGSEQLLQLMVEIKDRTSEPSLSALAEILGRNPEVFDPEVNPYAVRIVITGNVPEPKEFAKYPKFISFDGDIDQTYAEDELERVALFSMNLRAYSTWNGKGSFKLDEEKVVKGLIAKSHSLGKPIRFWGAPEGTTPYYTFLNFGIDYMNTDHPETAAAFYSDFANKNFIIGHEADGGEGITGTKVLDRATRGFAGFRNDKLALSRGIEVYTPSYKNDGSSKKIKNVIYLIGDGMGFNQIAAGYYANLGLSVLNMRYMGMQINCSKDQFTTDSAAAGSALATGERHSNRHISATDDNEPIPALSDWFHGQGRAVGVLTLGDVADATPAAYFGHDVERDNIENITDGILNGHVDWLGGSGMDNFTQRRDGKDIISEISKQYAVTTSIEEAAKHSGKVMCIDERMGKAAEEANLGLLAQATRTAIDNLSANKKGFFLMVEGAKIDYAGHSDCLPGSILEMLSFDMAIAEALKFADEDGQTLVVVTADHETGGLVLLDGDEHTGRIMGIYTTNDHTPAMLPVFAYGPGASSFTGTYKNIEIARRIKGLTK